jgi:predicted MFS family arabinose efflux permease
LFYLLAPVYSLSGTNPRSLLAGSLLINGVCIVATLLVVHRFAGEWSTRWAVAGVALLTLGANAIETFWNPSLEAPAVLLVMVMTAGAISGSGLSVIWMAVVGSYAVQTDVGTAPPVGVMAVCSIIGYLTQAGIRRRHHREVDHRERGLTPAMLAILDWWF